METEEATNEQATDWLEGQREISCLYTYVTVFNWVGEEDKQ